MTDVTTGKPRVWLVCNEASGSNDEQALAELEQAFADAGFPLDHKVCFPREKAPGPETLRREGVDLLCVFAGDGTLHACVTCAYGWDGPLLVLPGGTMNLLSKSLHGDVPATQIVARLAAGEPPRVRPNIVRTRHGDGLSGSLAGPGAVWNDVREAMRENDVGEFLSATTEAITKTARGPGVVVRGVDCEHEGGYAAITMNPSEQGIEARGYYAETIGEYAGHGLALLNRNFRYGPHDLIGVADSFTVMAPEGGTVELLIDGEPFDGEKEERFDLARCEVDLLATRDAR